MIRNLQVTVYIVVLLSLLAHFLGVAVQYQADKACVAHNIPRAKVVWFQGIYCISSYGLYIGDGQSGEIWMTERTIPLDSFPEAE